MFADWFDQNNSNNQGIPSCNQLFWVCNLAKYTANLLSDIDHTLTSLCTLSSAGIQPYVRDILAGFIPTRPMVAAASGSAIPLVELRLA